MAQSRMILIAKRIREAKPLTGIATTTLPIAEKKTPSPAADSMVEKPSNKHDDVDNNQQNCLRLDPAHRDDLSGVTYKGKRRPFQVLNGPKKFTPSTYTTRVHTRHILSFHRPDPWPPSFRYWGNSWIDDEAYSLPLRLVRAVKPGLIQVKHSERGVWVDNHRLTTEDKTMWMKRLEIRTEKALETHLSTVRYEAWQQVQDYGIGRWWFLNNRLSMSPYYSKVIEMARSGASIAGLACGFGQELRWLRDDGATGNMWAVDICPKM
jgi:hypothetical protein